MLDPNFRKLEMSAVAPAYAAAAAGGRVFLLDYDGTLAPSTSLPSRPAPEVLSLLRGLARDERNWVIIVSGRPRKQLEDWFGGCVEEVRARGREGRHSPHPPLSLHVPRASASRCKLRPAPLLARACNYSNHSLDSLD